MYHLPKGKVWDATLLVNALHRRGVKATHDGERIAMTLPVERIDIDRIVDAKTINELKPEIIGITSATIAFTPNAVLGNIVFECSRSFDADCYPRTADVTSAILDCGYDTGSDRELANKYYEGQIDINAIFAEIGDLQIDKEKAIAECRFDDAKDLHDKQRPFKQQIEDLLRDSSRDDWTAK